MNLTEYLKEDGMVGSVTTGAIAGVRAPLMKPIKRTAPSKLKIKKMYESNAEFVASDVESKVKDAEQQSKLKKDSVAYGIEDDDGNITKVYVAKEQDKDFKQALAELLSNHNGALDVAEILFDLRNTFDILYVEWPTLPEDEEVENELEKDKAPGEGEPGAEGEAPPEGEEGMGGPEGEDKGKPELPTEPEEPSGDTQSLLLQVIDMLKTDAEAKKAESNAKAKEAEAEAAKASLQLTNVKVKNEEEMLRADDYYKKQNDEKKEQERINKLAQYRNDVIKNTTYESKMTFLDILNKEIIEESAESTVNEDVSRDISQIQSQIADINLRKQRATKIYDDQLRLLQQRLQQKTKQADLQNKSQPAQNMQQQPPVR